MNPEKSTRRAWLREGSIFAAGLTLAPNAVGAELLRACAVSSGEGKLDPRLEKLFGKDPTRYRFAAADEAILEEIQRSTFQYFWESANPYTGLVKDRCQADGPDSRRIASIAATGFGLTALCIADKRGWQDHKKIRERVRNTLRFASERMVHEHGFLLHFIDMHDGSRAFHSEISSIDTAIFLSGALTCRGYFADHEIQDLAAKLYERTDWAWLLQGQKTMAMAWTPENGFTRARWDSYSEMILVVLLGLGSPTHALPAEAWGAFSRPAFQYYGVEFIGSHAPLFVHQFPQAWFDLRGKKDKYANYFTNSIVATKVHKLWCLELAKRFSDYSEDLWGISASDSAHGYVAWGGPPEMDRIDGSVVPCATAGSLPFMPEEALRVLRNIRERYGKRAWKKYGFVDAFNPLNNWTDADVVGIDAGITLAMCENARTGFVWQQFMKNEGAQLGMKRAGFAAE